MTFATNRLMASQYELAKLANCCSHCCALYQRYSIGVYRKTASHFCGLVQIISTTIIEYNKWYSIDICSFLLLSVVVFLKEEEFLEKWPQWVGRPSREVRTAVDLSVYQKPHISEPLWSQSRRRQGPTWKGQNRCSDPIDASWVCFRLNGAANLNELL